MKPSEKIESLRKSIINQEQRIYQHGLQDLRQRQDHLSKRESELTDQLSQERARSRMQQLEIDRRQIQLKESTELIRKLQEELESVWKKARMSWGLREAELKATKVEVVECNCKKKQLEDAAKNLPEENKTSESAEIKLLNSELEFHRRRYNDTKKALIELDAQCEKLMSKLRNGDAAQEATRKENIFLKSEIEDLRKQFTNKFKLQIEYETLKERNRTLEGKIAYFERELKEANTDHREELAKLSEQLDKTSSTPKQDKKEAEDGGSQLRQRESQIRSLERQLEQTKSEGGNLAMEMSELRKRELDVINENTLLRQNFAECLKKAENFRDQVKELTEANTHLKEEMGETKEKMIGLEDQMCELKNELQQKDKLIAYLQSVVQPKQMQKLARPRSSLLSSESDFLSDIESEYKQCQQLEKRRHELKVDLDKKLRVLSEKQNQVDESVPLLKDQGTFKPPQSSTISLKHSATDSTINTAHMLGKMRHDIPHRWKRQFVTVISNCCQVCMEGLPYFRHIFRCRDCAMLVHQHCKQSVVNTCGLPSECADFYLDTYSTSTSNEHMTGWVKLLKMTGDGQPEKWLNAWACIEEHKLAFFENDQLAVSNGVPFIRIDLDMEHWRIYNQTAEKPLDGIKIEDMSVLIELKMPNLTLLMLAPTVQAKQRWVQALQYATNRRIFIQRRPSSAIVNNSLLLALEAPRNLTINCTQILRNEWLLIGAQEGLFATSLQQQQLRAPFQIAGVSKLFWMELLPEFDMLLAICGTNRSLMCLHLQQLSRAFGADQQPSVHLTSVSGIEQCHIAVLSKEAHSRERRFLYLATIDSIVILHYVTKLGTFSPLKQFKTEEPCMCICSSPTGFIFGADNFHFVKFDDDFSSASQLMVDNCPIDFPVAAVEISDNEFLLAFHNFGLFVDSQGRRTRTKNVEWEKVPLEFAYIEPYLYIVYCEFIEIVRVAPLIGPESGNLTDDRNMFKCRSAHRTGVGINPQEVLFVVSSEDRVELHAFSRHEGDQAVKSILKRKHNETGGSNTLSGSTKKKH